MDNIGTIFYEQSSLVGARLTDNDASPDLIDDKTQWKRRVHNQHIINNQFIIRAGENLVDYSTLNTSFGNSGGITHGTNHRFQWCRQE